MAIEISNMRSVRDRGIFVRVKQETYDALERVAAEGNKGVSKGQVAGVIRSILEFAVEAGVKVTPDKPKAPAVRRRHESVAATG